MGVWDLFNTPGRDQAESAAAWTLTAQKGVDFSITAVSTKAASPEHVALVFRWADVGLRQRASSQQHAGQLVRLLGRVAVLSQIREQQRGHPNQPAMCIWADTRGQQPWP